MFEVRICMGSSCFSRGNAANLKFIQDYLAVRGLGARVVTVGHLCEDLCSEGPNVILDGVMHHAADAAALRVLLDRRFGTAEAR